MAKQSWFTAKARDGVGEIAILNDIGAWGVSAANFNDALEALGDVRELHIRISSDGGDVFHGFAVYNMLNRHAAHKVVTIEGLAASMASVIAMAGDEVVMPENAMIMIHNPWGGIVGESDQIISFGEALQKMREGIVKAYMARTGLKKSQLLAMMDKETWLDAKEAKALHFADRILPPMKAAASVTFNVSKFSNVPAKFGQIMRESIMAKKPKAAEDEESTEREEEAKTATEIRAELVAKHKEIRSVCRLAGKPELADKFIDEDKSVAEVVKALDELREKEAKEGKRGEVSARHNPNRAENAPEIDPVKIYSRWNSAGRKGAV